MKKMIIIMMMLIIATSGAEALQIKQIFYNADSSDDGKEFIEIYNPLYEPQNTVGFNIYTSTGDDLWNVVWNGSLEKRTVLPRSSFFIGENESFDIIRDLELQNNKGAVKLNEEIVGYGDSEVFEGSPVGLVSDGYSLLRVSDTGNNSADFVSSDPFFYKEDKDSVDIIVLNGAPVVSNLSAVAEDNILMLSLLSHDVNGNDDIDGFEYIFNDSIMAIQDFIMEGNNTNFNVSYNDQVNISVRALDKSGGVSDWISADIINAPFFIESIEGDAALPGETVNIRIGVRANKNIVFSALLEGFEGFANLTVDGYGEKFISKGNMDNVSISFDLPKNIPSGEYSGIIEISAVES
ncbi:MAG: hypothetical protein ACQER9_00015 [Nanobdellota archaeon]